MTGIGMRLSLALVIAALPRSAAAQAVPAGWPAVDSAIGRAGSAADGGVRKYTFPRRDLTVTVGDVAVMPALALRSWVAFSGTPASALLLGDLVLLEREVTPVITTLERQGVHATALHNHLAGESPRVMYLHVHGRGNAVTLARAIRAALAQTATPAAVPDGRGLAIRFQLDTAALQAALGRPGRVGDGVWQASMPRAELIRVGGTTVPPAMGVATSIGIQPLGPERAAVAGDFVLLPAEVTPVVQALEGGGIAVTAIHSHMVDEQPRLIFLHFWGTGPADSLARTLRSALLRTHVAATPGPRRP